LKQFYLYLNRFVREDFNIRYYSIIALFTAIFIGFNYAVDFEDGILDKLPSTFQRYLAFTSLYLFAYGFILVVNKHFYPQENFLSNKWLWIKIFIGFSILSFDTALNTYSLFNHLPIELYHFVPKVFNNLFPIISYILPLYLFYYYFDKQSNFYGITREGFEVRPYLQLFLIVVLLVGLASFHQNFNTYYPLYPQNKAAAYWGIPTFVTAGVYELAYGLSFVSVELLFRGFFVIGMIKILGRHAIIPMAVTYSFIHFGKPIGECVSSIFGGYILGVIALYSRNIWGGIIIHIGLAWLMEFFAYLQK